MNFVAKTVVFGGYGERTHIINFMCPLSLFEPTGLCNNYFTASVILKSYIIIIIENHTVQTHI